ISVLKNSITPKNPPGPMIGKPNAPCRPSFAAAAARGKFGSGTTSAIHAARPVLQTRPGSPTPCGNVTRRLTSTNSCNSRGRGNVHLRAAEHVRLGINAPAHSHDPVEAFANGLENAWHGLRQRRRFH